MVTELKILRWCDKCQAENEYMPAEEVLVRLGDGVRGLDLCEPHYKEYVEPLARLVQEVGHEPDRAPAPRAPKVAPQRLVTPGARVSSEKYTCLVCDKGTKAMSQHLKARHQMNMQTVYGTTCPLCGAEGKGVPGLGTHLNKAHGVHGIAQGFAQAEADGDPLGVIAGRRRVCASLTGRSEALFTDSP